MGGGIIEKLNLGFIRNIRSFSISLNQLIYTPKDKFTPTPPRISHPYGGYLSIGFGLHNRSDSYLENIALRIGVSGKPALGKESQDMIHKWLNLRLSRGWSSQIRTEFIINLYYDLTYKATILDTRYFGVDLLPNIDIALGNAHIYAKLGATLRSGYNLSSTFLSQGLSGENGGANSGRVFSDGLGIFGFIGVSGGFVGRNMFIQGNLFDKHSPRTKLIDFIGSLEAGFSIVSGDVSFTYKIIYTSKEFIGQDSAHGVGSFAIAYSF